MAQQFRLVKYYNLPRFIRDSRVSKHQNSWGYSWISLISDGWHGCMVDEFGDYAAQYIGDDHSP